MKKPQEEYEIVAGVEEKKKQGALLPQPPPKKKGRKYVVAMTTRSRCREWDSSKSALERGTYHSLSLSLASSVLGLAQGSATLSQEICAGLAGWSVHCFSERQRQSLRYRGRREMSGH
jgi:hypothetical protein